MDEDEAVAHGLTAAQSAAKAAAKAMDEDEAVAHNLLLDNSKNVYLRVTYNQEKEVYEIN
jgi:type IV secretory pathway VirB9-like protein